MNVNYETYTDIGRIKQITATFDLYPETKE